MNRALKYAIRNCVALQISKLDVIALRVIGFSESSFENSADPFSQLGHICLLGDDTESVVPISFKSYKSRRFRRSSMA